MMDPVTMKWTPHRLPDGHYCFAEDTCLSEFMRQTGRLDHDQAFLDLICRHIRPGTVVVDGGAFLGDHAVAYSKVASLVLAFEPYWPSYLGLCANVFVGRHFNIVPIHAGLSDEASHVVFGPMPGNVGAIVATPSGELQGEPGAVLGWPEDPVVCRLDQQGIGDVGLIKLDIEGFEVRALNGARETIARDKPVIVLEVNPGALEKQGTSAADLLDLVESLGYRHERAKAPDETGTFDVVAHHPDNTR